MALTDKECKNLAPSLKKKKYADGKGLYLEVTPKGQKYWRLKYRFGGKEKLLSLGVYPDVSLAQARERREEARKLLKASTDPAQAKKEAKRQALVVDENSFEAIAREWHENQKLGWTERHAGYVLRRLEMDIFPALGQQPLSRIRAPELLRVLRVIEDRGAIDIAHRAHQVCGQIFRYAIATGRAERDISTDLRGALKTRKGKHYARLETKELPAFLQQLEAYEGDLQTKIALKLMLLTFVRTTELRGARWEEFDLEKQEWRIPEQRMKMREMHIVPLSRQSITLLEELRPFTGHREHLFPNRNKPLTFISENTLLYALYRMGYHSRATTHGFRAMASSILNEHRFPSDIIERQLAHGERNKIRAAYNHAQYMKERKEMMQWWADYLDEAAGNGKVIVGKFGERV